MNILPEQVANETRVDDADPLILALKAAGAENPKIVLVFDENVSGTDKKEQPWKVRVLFRSPTELTRVRLDVPVVMMDTRVMPEGENVIRTVYPDGYIGWCGVIGGRPVWIT